MSGKPLKIFVNYRRADDPDFVQHMRTWFMIRYGRENVFMDFDTIPEFARFEDFIREKVRESDAVIAVIGHSWLDLLKERERSGKPDFVRIELEEALKFQKVIAPICIKGAPVPYSEEIPHHLQPIFQRNVAELRDGRDILEDIQRIMDSLEKQLSRQGVAWEEIEQPQVETALSKPQIAFDIWEAADHFSQAYEQGDWPNALGWIMRIRESGAAIPEFFKLDEMEAEISEILRGEEEARRRREMADHQYRFVRYMVRLRRPPEDIRAGLEEVWVLEPGYDPDHLAESLPVVQGQQPPRPNPSGAVRRLIGEPFEWVEIPDGFVILEGATSYGGTMGGKFEVQAFAIAKYPVTNAQYQEFIEASDGFRNPQWWEFSEHAARWYGDHPYPADTAFAGDDLPRTNINWYEALAFCNWLGHKTRQNILLPTEHQWQRAAQGDDRRHFPWGMEFHQNRCNFYASAPTPVTHYPKGASPYGVMDLCGNVWQWGLNEWGGASTDITTNRPRAVRGGTWWATSDEVLRCTYRFGMFPNLRLDGGGFRVALNY